MHSPCIHIFKCIHIYSKLSTCVWRLAARDFSISLVANFQCRTNRHFGATSCRSRSSWVYQATDQRVAMRERCRVSPPRFLAQCRKRLNQASFVFVVFCVVCFFWVVFSVWMKGLFLICLLSSIFQSVPTWMALYTCSLNYAGVPLWRICSLTHSDWSADQTWCKVWLAVLPGEEECEECNGQTDDTHCTADICDGSQSQLVSRRYLQ